MSIKAFLEDVPQFLEITLQDRTFCGASQVILFNTPPNMECMEISRTAAKPGVSPVRAVRTLSSQDIAALIASSSRSLAPVPTPHATTSQTSTFSSSTVPMPAFHSDELQLTDHHVLAPWVDTRTTFLPTIRNDYAQLSEIAKRMSSTQLELGRGIRAANSALIAGYYEGKRKVLGLFGVDFFVPDLAQTVSLQLTHVNEYGQCIHRIIQQTQRELKTTHAYVHTLADDLVRLYKRQDCRKDAAGLRQPADLLCTLAMAVDDPVKIRQFADEHDRLLNELIQSGDDQVANRAILRKREYVKHAYAVQLLLAGSLTAAKKIAVDAGCYSSMLSRLSSAYFSLGCNARQLNSIIGGLEAMQEFTDSMQRSVANALFTLDHALDTRRTTIGNTLENAVYKLGAR